MAEDRLSELDDVSLQIYKTEKQRKHLKRKTEGNIQGLWDNYKRYNICTMEITEGEKREKGTEDIFEVIMTENLSKLRSDTKSQIQNLREYEAR